MSGLRLTTTMLPISESIDRSRNTPFAKMSKLDLITCRAKSKKDQKINYHMTVALLTISTHHRKMLKYNQFIFLSQVSFGTCIMKFNMFKFKTQNT